MEQLYKICNNPDCWQVLGCMPKYTECKFCKWTTYDVVKWISHSYFSPYWGVQDTLQIWIVNYLWSHCHIVHRENRVFEMFVMANDEDLERCN